MTSHRWSNIRPVARHRAQTSACCSLVKLSCARVVVVCRGATRCIKFPRRRRQRLGDRACLHKRRPSHLLASYGLYLTRRAFSYHEALFQRNFSSSGSLKLATAPSWRIYTLSA